MAEQVEVDMLRQFMGLDNAVNLFGLPVDDAGDDERKAATGLLLLEPVSAVEGSPVPIADVTREGVNLLPLEQSAPVTGQEGNPARAKKDSRTDAHSSFGAKNVSRLA